MHRSSKETSDMSRMLYAVSLLLGSASAFACPTVEIGKTFEVDQSVAFRFQGPRGYEMQASEMGGALVSVNLRPEGTTSMDIATGKVTAPTIRMGLALRPIPPEEMQQHLATAEGKPFIELAAGLKAFREDIARLDIRHYLYPEIDGHPRELEVIVMVPPGSEQCLEDYEPMAHEILRSLEF
jgi:hypothetical protein